MKMHYSHAGATNSACGRGRRTTTNVYSVTCGLCQNKTVFLDDKEAADAQREAEFQAQEPHTIVPMFGRVNDDGVMDCYSCHGVLFRERPRSLFSYHYVCVNCGTSMHPLTETGMCT